MEIFVQYVSDVHLEFYDVFPSHLFNQNFVKAKYLCLAGDIGYPFTQIWVDFMVWCSKSYQKVFYVMGNHELYGRLGTMESVCTRISGICEALGNVFFLRTGDIVDLDGGWKVIGCTLWSRPTLEACNGMNDQYQILDYRRVFSWNLTDKAWLSYYSQHFNTDKTIVLTHYLPSYHLIEHRYKDNPCNSAFANDDMDHILSKFKVWIYGHTHAQNYRKIGDTMCYVNAVGYKNEGIPKDIVKCFLIHS